MPLNSTGTFFLTDVLTFAVPRRFFTLLLRVEPDYF